MGNNTPDEEFPATLDYRRSFNFMLGGPIIKDKLWIIGQYQRSGNREVPVGVELTDDVLPGTANKYFFKINAQLSDKDRLAFTFDLNQFDDPVAPWRTNPVESSQERLGTIRFPLLSVRARRISGTRARVGSGRTRTT